MAVRRPVDTHAEAPTILRWSIGSVTEHSENRPTYKLNGHQLRQSQPGDQHDARVRFSRADPVPSHAAAPVSGLAQFESRDAKHALMSHVRHATQIHAGTAECLAQAMAFDQGLGAGLVLRGIEDQRVTGGEFR